MDWQQNDSVTLTNTSHLLPGQRLGGVGGVYSRDAGMREDRRRFRLQRSVEGFLCEYKVCFGYII